MENKYSKSKIYKITDANYTEFYYGSTIQALSMRLAGHKYDYKRGHKCTVNDIFEKYGIDNCKIELVEIFCCGSKEEMMKKEGEYLQNNICVNKNKAGIDTKNNMPEYHRKWAEENKDAIKERKKAYYLANKEMIDERNRNYRLKYKNNINIM